MMISTAAILNATILIVDDQAVNIMLLEQLLSEAGYTHVSSTMKPTEVCALHQANDYDLILLDLQMPEMDGFQVMGALKAVETRGYIPVIVLTAQPAHKLRALQGGAKDFISKPFDLVEVKTRIHNMLEVRLLYKELEKHNQQLEQTVAERTAELRESEARYRSLTELASDWYWEQDENALFTRVSGPVAEMLGVAVPVIIAEEAAPNKVLQNGLAVLPPPTIGAAAGWNEAERAVLNAKIAARQPFIDFVFHRTNADGTTQQFRVSGQPIFNESLRFLGYRGIGVEFSEAK